MKKKAQMEGMGLILATFISIVVGVILFQAIAQNVGESTNTVAVSNQSLGTVLNNSVIYITNYKSISGVVIYNSTTSVVADTEYTIANDQVYNGALAIKVTVDADDGDSQTGNEWFISGTAEPLTYISDSGSRSMAMLIVIMFALALVAVALYPVYKGGLANLLGK